MLLLEFLNPIIRDRQIEATCLGAGSTRVGIVAPFEAARKAASHLHWPNISKKKHQKNTIYPNLLRKLPFPRTD